MLLQALLVGVFGIVIALIGLVVGIISSFLLVFYRKGVKQERIVRSSDEDIH